VQLWTISPRGGSPRQITRDSFDIASAFTWNAAGTHIAYIADGSVFMVEVATGRSQRLTAKQTGDDAPLPEACVFSPDGRQIAYVRPVATLAGRFNQILVTDANA
jgi:Tol biopolymer transport system component